jgi:hypothetical protein
MCDVRQYRSLTVSDFAESMGAVYNSSITDFLLKTDELYEVVMYNDVKEALVLPTTVIYTFSLSTNVRAAEIISPMEPPFHFRIIGFSDYNDGKLQKYIVRMKVHYCIS